MMLLSSARSDHLVPLRHDHHSREPRIAALHPMPRKPGRPAYTPTEKDRATVKTMSAFGIPDYEIARVLSVDPKTLRKHFWTELEVGHVEANAKVAASLFKKATGDGRESVVAAIFWLKCRAGWRERPATDELGKKEQRALEAETAERGTSWESLLEPASTRLQ